MLQKSKKEEMIKLMVTGGRDYTNYDQVVRVLTSFVAQPVVLIHGACKWEQCQMLLMSQWVGADMLCERFAISGDLEGKWSIWRWPAAWPTEGKPAGIKRNIRMIDGSQPHVVIGFPGGRGTLHACEYAYGKRIPVVRVGDGTSDEKVGELALKLALGRYERRTVDKIMRGW